MIGHLICESCGLQAPHYPEPPIYCPLCYKKLEAQRDVSIRACQEALESIEILEGILPEGSLARGSFDGAFLGVKAKLRAAIKDRA